MSALVVLGDVLLDRDVVGAATRLCPDGPVPVVEQLEERVRAGGAGLTASLLRRQAPDAAVRLVTAVAADDAGVEARRWIEEQDIEVVDLVDHGTTGEKIRVRVDGRTLLRVDRGRPGPIGGLPDAARPLRDAAAVLVSDYGRGITSHPEVRTVLAAAIAEGVPVVWDPHPRGAPPVPGTTLALPNAIEAGLDRSRPDDLARVARRAVELGREWQVGAVALTMGAGGALLASGDGVPLVVPVEVVHESGDTCGAGDAFAAAVTAALAEGALLSQAVLHGVTTATTYVSDGRGAPTDPSHTSPATRPGTGCTVAAGGCFDILHAGHVAMLRHARRLGDRLVVLLNSDDSVRRLKGPGRPVQRQVDRAAVLRSLSCVDEVVVFDEDTPVAALDRLRPDVFVKGGDYTHRNVREAAAVGRWGGTVVTVPYVDGLSTTRLLATAQGAELGGGRGAE